jgi:hypothetical protein
MKDNGWVTDRMLADWKEEPEQSVASFAYTAALALGALATLPEVELGAEKTKLTVHAMGAAKYREGSVEASFGRLCAVAKQSLKPFALLAEVDIVLVGPDMPSADPVVVERDGCKTTVTTFCGGYSENVAQATLVPPDLVVGFDVDAYTCSWRKSLLYLLQAKLPTVLSFMMPHEALWVEELLARPRRRHLCHPAPPQPALPPRPAAAGAATPSRRSRRCHCTPPRGGLPGGARRAAGAPGRGLRRGGAQGVRGRPQARPPQVNSALIRTS